MRSWLYDLCAKGSAVLLALVAMQMPMFIQQYVHQLQGHLSELRLQVAEMERVAAQSGKSLPEYIGKFLESGDLDFAAQGSLMHEMMGRAELLQQHSNALMEASIWSKPLLFATHFDLSIARDTFSHFQLGVPLSIEGACYGVVGVLISSLLFAALLRMFRRGRQLLPCRQPVVRGDDRP
jgi:hypothetical protein